MGVAFQVLGARSVEKGVEPLQDARAAVGRPDRQDHQEVSWKSCLARTIQTIERLHSRYVNVGLFYLRQLFFATFDLSVHNNSLDVNTDYTKLWNELRERISLVQGGEYTHGQGTFGHITGGYDAGYYG